jgi:four helix bundle protein
VKDYRTLKVWEKSHALVLAVYGVSRNFPSSELYGLSSQIRRSAISIPANIAEGCGRDSNADFNHFLKIAMGSATELDYHLLLSKDLGLIKLADFAVLSEQANEVRRMLASLIRKIKSEC